ncbi:Aminoglycoside phosphotransferase [Penicillium paradoxum]|uniref:Aminoglycoside phosphotransferase n=1 Tax=Penicillium paradoxum TaxID=176176 RepID=UPI002547DA5A|nr:Aminoglycoside phosphotransferase [Penicillium paradoxum]KAJ5772958.1 Aminoglycoside phosphotransferase [Penicillium paradoxum]
MDDKEAKTFQPMQENQQSGDLRFSYAAQKNLAFDAIYWQKLNCCFFSPATERKNAWQESE